MRASQVYRWIESCAGWLWPPRCVLCGGCGRLPDYDLCAACEAEFPLVSMPCARCGLPRAALTATEPGDGCDRCRALDLPYARCLAPWAYEFPVTRLVQALKYEGALANARILGSQIAAVAGPALCALSREQAPPLLVPMPLHPSRLIERGFNQSGEIARIVARRLELRLAESALHRTRATAPQVGLARHERAGNLKGAFAADARVVAGRAVILVDDVVTTGSTVAEAARTLLEARATTVHVWAAARVPG